MAVLAFRGMEAVGCADDGQVAVSVTGYRNGERLGKRIYGSVVRGADLAALPVIVHVGQHHQANGHHYYVWRVLDRRVDPVNHRAEWAALVCAIVTGLVAGLAPRYYKLLAITTAVGCLISIAMACSKPRRFAQSHWVQGDGAMNLRYDVHGQQVSSSTGVLLTPENQYEELPGTLL